MKAPYIFLLFLVLISLSIISFLIGPYDILAQITKDGFQLSEELKFILLELRLPRTVALISIGASLSLCGVLLQTLLANPLAEPFTLGLSGTSTLGAVAFLFFGFSPQWLSLPVGSLIGSLFAIVLVLSLQKKLSSKSHALILTGVMLSFFSGALVTLIVSVMDPHQMQQVIYWMMGQVGSPRDSWSYFLFPMLFGVFSFFYLRRPHLDKLLLGFDTAKNLGVRIEREKFYIIILCSVLTALSVSISGLVGFVGLVAPHLSYVLVNSRRHTKSLLVAPLVGACLFLLADILSRMVSQDVDVPAGSFMALFGAPLLIYFLLFKVGVKNER